MAETILLALAEWSIRATVLAGAVGALLWAARIKNAHIKLTRVDHCPGSSAADAARRTAHADAFRSPCRGFLRKTHEEATTLNRPSSSRRASSQRQRPQNILSPHATDIAAVSWLLIALTMLFRLRSGIAPQRAADAEQQADRRPTSANPIWCAYRSPWASLASGDPAVRLARLARAKLRAVTAHEQAHVARHDPLRQLAASIYRSVAWFHPLAWWLDASLPNSPKQASDDAAIAAGEDRVKYAEALLSFIERTPSRVQWEGSELWQIVKTRMRRIDRVLDQNRELSRPSNHRALAALILAALPLIYLATATRPVWAQASRSTPRPAEHQGLRRQRRLCKLAESGCGIHHHATRTPGL